MTLPSMRWGQNITVKELSLQLNDIDQMNIDFNHEVHKELHKGHKEFAIQIP